MPFEENSRLDPSQVEDRRGGGFGRGGRGPGLAVGGGGLGLVAMLVIAMLFGVDPGALIGASPAGQEVSTQYETGSGDLAQECQTGADANARDDCRALGYINSVQAFWRDEFSRRGSTYSPAKTVFFSDATEAACGYASSASGPFYCPADRRVYVDLTFFEDMRRTLGVRGEGFAMAYVLAHEYGHHVQNLIGELGNSQGAGATGGSVRTELQADCLAGVWTKHAEETGFLTGVTDQEIREALDAAGAVGDDRLQRQSQGRVTPDSFTHGTSEQRQRWFRIGVQSGDLQSCDTSGRL